MSLSVVKEELNSIITHFLSFFFRVSYFLIIELKRRKHLYKKEELKEHSGQK